MADELRSYSFGAEKSNLCGSELIYVRGKNRQEAGGSYFASGSVLISCVY